MAKRSLILAGGGLKVGFQAGVLQVWLDEAGLSSITPTARAAAASTWRCTAQGMTGRQIADNWRNLDPFLPVDLNVEGLVRFLNAPSLFTYDRFREHVLPLLGHRLREDSGRALVLGRSTSSISRRSGWRS